MTSIHNSINSMINIYINNCKEKIDYSNIKCVHNIKDKLILHNINKILHNKNIVVKLADKSLGLVILPLVEYNSLCEKILSDTSTYKNIQDVKFVEEMINQLQNILRKHDKFEFDGRHNKDNNNIFKNNK